MRFFTITSFLAALAAASPIVEYVERQDRPDPRQVTISEVTGMGSGCPPGTFSSSITGNGTIVSVSYSRFIAQTGRNTQPNEDRRNCNLKIKLNVPNGLSYTATNTIQRGKAKLSQGCTGAVGNRFYFSGESNEATSTSNFVGPFNSNFVRNSPVDLLIWSTCAAPNRERPEFNINTDASVDCDSIDKNAWIGLDMQDSKFELRFLLEWRTC